MPANNKNKKGGACDSNTCDDAIISVKSEEIKPTDEKDMRCAPTKEFKDGSCIPLSALVAMANAFNKYYPNNQIKLSTTIETLNEPKYKKYLVKQFQMKLKKKCDNQRCWLEQPFIKIIDKATKEELEKNTLRPKGPSGKFTWLNTINIDEVAKQYEVKYPEFKFLGAVPIDFDSWAPSGIPDLDFKKLMSEGKTKFGVVFNLDAHDEPGSHWTALFFDLKQGNVYYSDSYGLKPEKRINNFMRRIAKLMKDELNINPVVDYNRQRHQKQNSDCGVYSLSFILRLIRGNKFEDINARRIPDEEINECRKFYFT